MAVAIPDRARRLGFLQRIREGVLLPLRLFTLEQTLKLLSPYFKTINMSY